MSKRLPGPLELARRGEAGRAWYYVSAQAIDAWATEEGHDPDEVADIMAVTSPRVHVKRNVGLTVSYFRKGGHQDVPGMLPMVRKGIEHYERTGEIRGPKTSAFARALKGDGDAVVIDVWMLRAFGMDPGKSLSKGMYREMVRRVRGIATRLGWPPAEAQAAIWTGVRAEYGFHKASAIAF